jgi:multidrug transporter EmrE-like cation transporter
MMRDQLTSRGLALAALTALCSGVGITLLKIGVTGDRIHILALLLGVVIYGVGIVLGIVLLSVYPLSLAYPVVVGLSLTVLAAISTVYLGEPISGLRLLGTVLVVVGIALLVGRSEVNASLKSISKHE